MKKIVVKVLGLVITAGMITGLFPALAGNAPSLEVSAASGETVFLSFDNMTNISSLISQQDLSAYGVGKATLSSTSSNTDSGTGLKVSLDRDSSRFCQSLTWMDSTATANAFKNAGNYQFLRMWVYNPDAEEIGVCIQLSAGSKTAMLSASTARVTRCDGKAMTLKTADFSGIGKNCHVVVPSGFAGWIAWPLNSKLEQAWSSPLLSSIADTTSFKMDIRPQGAGGSTYYILDNASLSSLAAGTSRTYTDPTTAGLTEKKQEMNTMINGYLSVTPKITELPQYNPDSDPSSGSNEWSNIRAITYDGATIGGKKTKVFAYIGFPAGASSSSKVPAVVLIHGGGGHVYAEWIKQWTDRGYAAIAMDNTGYFPSPAGKGVAGRESDYYKSPAYWQYGLYGDFKETGYVNAPNNDYMGSSAGSVDAQWMYHAVVQSVLAHNILLHDGRVNTTKIGINGISWGGIISSIAIGYDTRYAFGVPVYGAGYLDQGLSYQRDYFSPAATKALWSASEKFNKVKFPVFWVGWTNDPNFSIQSNSLSYEATKSTGSILSMKMDWSHGHSSGWLLPDIYRFADSVVKGGVPLTKCVTEPAGTRSFSFTVKKPSDANSVTAKAYYLTEKMTYSMNGTLTSTFKVRTIDQQWLSVNCNVSGNTVTGVLPSNAVSYYVEITTVTAKGSFITSTKYFETIGSGSGSSATGSVSNSVNTGNNTSSGSKDSSGSLPGTVSSDDGNSNGPGESSNGSTDEMSASDTQNSSAQDSTASAISGGKSDSSSGTTPGKNPALIPVLLILAVVLVAGGGTFFFIKRKKNS